MSVEPIGIVDVTRFKLAARPDTAVPNHPVQGRQAGEVAQAPDLPFSRDPSDLGANGQGSLLVDS